MRRADESTTTGSGSLLTRCRPATACVRRFVHQSQMPLNEYKILSSSNSNSGSRALLCANFIFFYFFSVSLRCDAHASQSVCMDKMLMDHHQRNGNGHYCRRASTQFTQQNKTQNWTRQQRMNRRRRELRVQNRIHLERDRCTIPKKKKRSCRADDWRLICEIHKFITSHLIQLARRWV